MPPLTTSAPAVVVVVFVPLAATILPSDIIVPDEVNVVNYIDDSMVEYGDDFGFNEENFDFGDGKIYSPTKLTDI